MINGMLADHAFSVLCVSLEGLPTCIYFIFLCTRVAIFGIAGFR